GEMTDPRDKQVYKTVVIGTQMWMAENLNYDTLDGMGSWCYENSADSCTKFGRLYQWVVAMVLDSVYNDTIWSGSGVNRQGICPSGWHLPSNDEWQTLAAYVSAQSGVGGKDVDGSWSAIGTLLKSTTEWPSYSGVATGTNTFGFSALPGGYRLDGGDFVGVDRGTFFWSSTESSYYYYAYNRTLTYYSEYFNNIDNFKKHAFSVRCVKDL
ncbi:MAG: fibrobacter succinogenes major paralogous domain-containing protein, partial [Sphaerochaetaceae bacterium]